MKSGRMGDRSAVIPRFRGPPAGAKMREECSMSKQQTRRARRSFSPELKAEAVRLCKVGDRSIGQIAKELALTETGGRSVAFRSMRQC